MRKESTVTHFSQKFADTDCVLEHFTRAAHAVCTVRRIIPPRKRLFDVDDRIDTEAGKSLIQPPVDHFIDFLAQLRIFPVQIRLLFVEHVQIIFVWMTRERFPDTAAEVRTPVAWQFSVRTVFNVKIFSVLAIRILAGFFEPFVLIGAVIDDEIH